MIILYLFFLLILTIYSYVLVDPNFTLVNLPFWTTFRNTLVYFGYYQRYWSWLVYLVLVLVLFIFYLYFLKHIKKYNPFKLALFVGGILILSYPFLSHDFFNYLFDARIATLYFKNPYFYKALDFPADPWLRFMHWTHRTYPYGPIFLLITLFPSFLSFGKLFLSFLFFKITWYIFYLLAVFLLTKLNKKWAMIFAVHPLIIIEGLINAHNDLIGLSLAIIGIFYLIKNKNILGRLILIFSAGIKYITFPLIFLPKKRHPGDGGVIFIILMLLIAYLTFFGEIQPWYFLAFFAFIPYFEKLLFRFNIFFMGLLFSYYPYIRLGGWDSVEKTTLKHIIILVFGVINLFYFIIFKKHEKFDK